MTLSPGASGQGLAADYERARSFIDGTPFDGLAIGFPDRPRWIEGTHTFWYRVSVEGGYRFVRVDADAREKAPAFDHERLAAALSNAAGARYTAVTLPFAEFDPGVDLSSIRFDTRSGPWRCDLSDYRCEQTQAGAPGSSGTAAGWEAGAPDSSEGGVARSPDGRWEALVRDYNVAVRRVGSDELRVLSYDGSDSERYVLETFAWSPDSRKLAAYRVRPGLRRINYFVDSRPDDEFHARPLTSPTQLDIAGDPRDVQTPVLFDLETGAHVVDRTLFPVAFSQTPLRWWDDGRGFYFGYLERGAGAYRLIEVDGETGEPRALIYEPQEDIRVSALWTLYEHPTRNGEEIIFASTRDGWRHLYLYDGRTGEVKNQITRGEWAVRAVDWVDESNRQIWFRAMGTHEGQDPYFQHYYRIGFDGSGLTEFTSANGNHTAWWSSDRAFYVDTWSRADTPPQSVLRWTEDQSVVMELERGDVSRLIERGWSPPEPFVAKGRDGVTDIWGVIQRPSNFDPSKTYPVVERIYAGPVPRIAKDMLLNYLTYGPDSTRLAFRYDLAQQMALAEVGFIVVEIDGMGHAYRGKAFRDVAWKNRTDDGLPDRIPWHRAVAERYPYYDISRVGVYGESAGGRAAVGAMLFQPDFYDAAVSWNGGQDARLTSFEMYLGWPPGPEYVTNSNVEHAWRLQGRLFLGVSELDLTVPPTHSYRLIDALIEADKDFELLVVPGAGHFLGYRWEYRERRWWDFFVRHLYGIEPPNWNDPNGG